MREWSLRALWWLSGVPHILNTQHLKPGCSGLLCWVEEMLRGLDTSFLSQYSPRPVFFLCLQFFAHLSMPISKASPHQPERTQGSRREPTDHDPMSTPRAPSGVCVRQTLPILTVKFRIHTLPKRQDLPHKARDRATPTQMLLRAGSCPELSLPAFGVAISSRVLGSSVPPCPSSPGR